MRRWPREAAIARSVRRTSASWIGMNRLRRMNCESEMCQRSQNSITFRDMIGAVEVLGGRHAHEPPQSNGDVAVRTEIQVDPEVIELHLEQEVGPMRMEAGQEVGGR